MAVYLNQRSVRDKITATAIRIFNADPTKRSVQWEVARRPVDLGDVQMGSDVSVGVLDMPITGQWAAALITVTDPVQGKSVTISGAGLMELISSEFTRVWTAKNP